MKFVYKGKTVPLGTYIIFRSKRTCDAIAKRVDLGKVFLTMRITAILLLIGTLQVMADNSYAQQVSLRKKDATLLEVLKSVRKQTGYLFICDLEMLDKAEKVNINVSNTPLREVLDACFARQPLTYNIVDKTIIVKKKKVPEQKAREEAEVKVPYPYFPDPDLKQRMKNIMHQKINAETLFDITVQGKVTDEKGEVLAGVNIVQKGTQRGTSTDEKGMFSIDITDPDAVLIFSFVGYISQETTVARRSTINIVLKVDNKALEEVVVVGYGTQKRSDLTGSVSSVKAEDIKNLPVRSVTEALQGRAAGVQVTRNDGAPGSSSDIVIRGVGSIGGMAPLYIVDGIRMTAGNNFNLQDVESIEILKDASAAAIYGAQAAGGVVLVTTKRGTSLDKMSINFNAYYGVRQVRNLYSLLNTADYYKAKTAFGVATNSWGDPNTLPDNDWIKQLYTNGKEESYSLSLSGATAKTNYYLSANYQKEGGTIIDNYFKRYGLRSNADFKINSKFKVGETIYAWMTDVNPTQTTTFPFRSAPVVPVYDPSNQYGGWAKTGSYFGGPNLVAQEYQNHIRNQTYAVEGNLYADWEIISGLNFRSTFGASVFSEKNQRFNEAFDYGIVANRIAFLSRDINSQRNFTANLVLTYSKVFGQHDFKVMAGYEAYKSDRSTLHGEAQGFPYVTYNLGLSTNPASYVASGAELPQTRLLSQFGRINYTYSNKYLITATIRRDGSDRFGPSNKWGIFPSASVGWKINEEAFIRDNFTYISNLKLRASYGKLGSTSNIPQYTYQSSYGGTGGTNSQGLPDGSRSKGYALTAQLANQNIKWESVLQTDLGLDIGLLKNALNITIDWYSRQTQGMIYQVPVALSAGFGSTSVFTNIGQMSNKGLELAVDYRGRKGAFTYAIGANASFNKNLVKQLDGNNNNPISDGAAGNDLDGNAGRTQVGHPMSQFFGYQVDGLFQSDAEVASLNEKAQQQAGSTSVFFQNSGTAAGDLKFRDTNGDGRITTADKVFIGNPWPKLTYGLTLNLGWKGLELTALFQGIKNVDVYNGNKYYTEYLYGDYNTTKDIFNASFFNGNGLTSSPRVGVMNASGTFARDPNSNYGRISDYFVEDGSFLKLRNIQIGYTIPNKITSALKISDLKVYVQGQNLLTFTKYSGLDPEVLGRNGTTARGIDTIFSYPRNMLLSMGLNLSF
ncbi:TonB-dependent receptor P3 [Dyadobacter sp. CECT 9275]|uniref:TonB-dependent receptor P3 n=1 Tax=Dyadobacter helix TaxID=2822344 RepID=A0A916JFG1_9BACT|nr:TonB-dependent receptor [Dyadobacter sp. CECT 9275]CAG5003186.1 TonB-dependent receptor P3 [Dyadobacter sp. CECT 9275]